MSISISTENLKTLRTAMILELKIQSGGTMILVDNPWIKSCKLSLHGVSTNRDNPELEASTIEAVILKKYGDWDLSGWWERFKGKAVSIQYRAGYRDIDESEDFSAWRTFYSTLDEENFTDENGLITIKGTDRVGLVAEQHPGGYITAEYRATQSGTSYRYMGYLINSYIYEILKPFMPSLTAPQARKSWNTGTIYEKTPDFISDDNKQHILIESKSRRKLVANFMNLFPGTETQNLSGAYNLNSKKFIFRDAGIPEAGWCDYANGGNGSTLNIRLHSLAYNFVSDYKEIQGPIIKEIKIANPDVSYQQGISDPEAIISGYKHIEDKAVEAGKDYIIDLGEPYYSVAVSNSVGSATMINPQTVSFKASATGISSIDGLPIQKTYPANAYANAGVEKETISINASEGNKTIELEDFNGLRNFSYHANDNVSSGNISDGIASIIANQYIDTAGKRQEWITFKWRGDPRMQPRDILWFYNDKERKHWIYEIDSLTLEHEGGGLISEVKALKRFENPLMNF